jgi:NAD(P)-dependent dehydrogenase (short-subunit alcohol dehydrogenase family)
VSALFDLTGRVALVTGASRGIGRGVAIAFGAAGAAVACCARSVELIAATAAEVRRAGGKGEPFPLDVTSRTQIDAAVIEIERALGPIDILVNNAGAILEMRSLDVTDDEWDRILTTNVTSAFRLARAVGPGMIARRRGKIINIGSMYGTIGVPRYAAYCASKGAVEALTRSLAAEWARHGIQVNCVAPGYVDTDISRPAMADDQTRAHLLSRVPARRVGEPEEVGALAVYLASSASDFMTGQTLHLDGGQTIAW